MKIKSLNKEYDRLQKIYGDPNLHSIYNGGLENSPDICFVFMNPTGRNIASLPGWKGPYHPWLGTKNIWDLFIALNLIDQDLYDQIKSIKGSSWTPEFANLVYENITKHKVFITNLGKCTQTDARPLNDNYFKDYLPLLEKEISIIKPKIIILFGNQVSSIFLNQKISVSQTRKQSFPKIIAKQKYQCFPVYYPVGNGRFNLPKAIEDIKWIINSYLKEE